MRTLIERKYDVGSSRDAAAVIINEPCLTERDWLCVYKIDVLGHVLERQVYGVDKLQSLTLALRKISAELEYLSENRDDKITWMGDSRLDLI